MEYRIEKDTMGEVRVPKDALYRAQTQRAVENFPISGTPLEKEHIHQIIEIELKKLFERIKDIGYHLSLSDKARDYIAEKGFDKQYGARPLKRAIQKYIEDVLAEEIVNSKLTEGDSISMDLDEGEDRLTITIEKGTKTSREA